MLVLTDYGFGLYVHWPFCQAKCPYCDFNSHVVTNIDQNDWADAFVSEVERYGQETGPRTLNSIFFGGGTPSLMPPKTVEAIISAAQKTWQFSNDIEITLEANPTSVEAGNFRGFAQAGINRVSVGVQALNDDDLRSLGRLHSVDEALQAIEIANSAFARTSFDLIYARQNQTIEAWETELKRALGLAGEHLSLYQLTIEDGTAFGNRFRAGKLRGLPNEDLQADMYELTQELCLTTGYGAYEISNHARPGSESRHNLIYWTSGEFAGIGPGAHGRLTIEGRRLATVAPSAPVVWLGRAISGLGFDTETLTANDVLEEKILMGLRLSSGVYLTDEETSVFYNKIKALENMSLLSHQDNHLTIPAQHRLLQNRVVAELLS